MGEYVLSFIDAAGKRAHSSVRTGPINAGTIDEVEGQAAAYLTAVQAIVLGHVAFEELDVYRNVVNAAVPTNTDAVKIVRWRITWVDTTQWLDPPDNTIPNPTFGKIFTDHLYTADTSKTVSGSNEVDLTVSPWPTFKTDFEALARSKSNGQPQIQSIILLDR